MRLVLAQNSPELSLLKFLPLTYHHAQPFLGRHLGFHIFFHHSLLEGRTLFLQLGCFGLDFTSFCICIPQSLGLFKPFFSFFLQEEEKMKQMNTLIFLILSINIQIIYIIHIFITELYMVVSL